MADSSNHPIHGTSALQPSERFTLDQWRSWPEDERWELISGVAYDMSPAPRTKHQKAVLSIGRQLGNFLEGKPGQPFIAPCDVFLPSAIEGNKDTVVQPDVLVVCDPAKVLDDGIHGSPDFIAEVLSDSTAYKDMGVKKNLYERAGVREFWMVNPENGSVFRYVLAEGRYGPGIEILAGQTVESAVFAGFSWISA